MNDDVKKYKVVESFELPDGSMSEVGSTIDLQDLQAEALGAKVELMEAVDPIHEVGEKCTTEAGEEGTYQSTPEGMVCVANPSAGGGEGGSAPVAPAPAPHTPEVPAAATPETPVASPVEAKPWAGNHKVPA